MHVYQSTEISTGCAKGHVGCIPRISMTQRRTILSNSNVFDFPVILCFATTIVKRKVKH